MLFLKSCVWGWPVKSLLIPRDLTGYLNHVANTYSNSIVTIETLETWLTDMVTKSNWTIFHIIGPLWGDHDDVIKWKHFPRNWPFVRKIHRSPVNFPHKGQWRGALMFSLIYVWINDWANNREAGDLRRQHGHYDVIVMTPPVTDGFPWHSPVTRSFDFLIDLCWTNGLANSRDLGD